MNLAIEGNYIDLVALLFEAGVTMSPSNEVMFLQEAASRGKFKIFGFLLQNVSDLSDFTSCEIFSVIEAAMPGGYASIIWDMMFRYDAFVDPSSILHTLVMDASHKGDLPLLEGFARAGIWIDFDFTPLYHGSTVDAAVASTNPSRDTNR